MGVYLLLSRPELSWIRWLRQLNRYLNAFTVGCFNAFAVAWIPYLSWQITSSSIEWFCSACISIREMSDNMVIIKFIHSISILLFSILYIKSYRSSQLMLVTNINYVRLHQFKILYSMWTCVHALHRCKLKRSFHLCCFTMIFPFSWNVNGINRI